MPKQITFDVSNCMALYSKLICLIVQTVGVTFDVF